MTRNTGVRRFVAGKVCSIDGCEKPMKSRGWCGAHYRRWLSHGDPTGGGPAPAPAGAPKRFIFEVALPFADSIACLTWPFAKDANGYAQINGMSQRYVSRIVCEAKHGPPPTPASQARHSCGNGHLACISPHHVAWGTRRENEADKRIHGTIVRGERSNLHKLSEADVQRIRGLVAQGVRQQTIADMFGIANSTVSVIGSGKSWGWLPTPQNNGGESHA